MAYLGFRSNTIAPDTHRDHHDAWLVPLDLLTYYRIITMSKSQGQKTACMEKERRRFYYYCCYLTMHDVEW